MLSTRKHLNSTEFLAVVNAPEPLTMVLKSHLCIEVLLTLALTESLAVPHALELRRTSFNLKAELAVALGVVPADSRALLLAINRLRNSFAHDPNAVIGQKQVSYLFSALSPRHKAILKREFADYEDKNEVFRECATLIYVELKASITRMRDKCVYESLLNEEIKTLISQKPDQVQERRRLSEPWEREMAARVDEERRKRQERGEL